MKLSIGLRIASGFSLALAIFMVMGLVSYRNLDALDQDVWWVEHTLQVLRAKEGLTTNLFEMQSASRGYFISGEPQLKKRFEVASRDLLAVIAHLRVLTADDPMQQQRLIELEEMLDSRMMAAGQLIAIRDSGADNGSMLAEEVVKTGSSLAQRVRALTDEIEVKERDLLESRKGHSVESIAVTRAVIIYGTIAALVIVVVITVLLTRRIAGQARALVHGSARLATGNYQGRVVVDGGDEMAQIAAAFNRMAEQIEHRQHASVADHWIKTCLSEIALLFARYQALESATPALLKELARMLGLQRAALYARDTQSLDFNLVATYAGELTTPEKIVRGRGLAGQAIADRKTIITNDLPPLYMVIQSGLGQITPRTLIVIPALNGGEVQAVLELASLHVLDETQNALVRELSTHLGLLIANAQKQSHIDTMTIRSPVPSL